MDVGVGSFLIASALTSKHARSVANSEKDKKPPSYLSLITSAFKSVSPLIVIGLGRLLSVKSTNYQVLIYFSII